MPSGLSATLTLGLLQSCPLFDRITQRTRHCSRSVFSIPFGGIFGQDYFDDLLDRSRDKLRVYFSR